MPRIRIIECGHFPHMETREGYLKVVSTKYGVDRVDNKIPGQIYKMPTNNLRDMDTLTTDSVEIEIINKSGTEVHLSEGAM